MWKKGRSNGEYKSGNSDIVADNCEKCIPELQKGQNKQQQGRAGHQSLDLFQNKVKT